MKTKKNIGIIAVAAVLLFAVSATNAFGQTTADEWVTKGDEYFDKKDYSNAIKAYSEAIKRDSTNIDTYWSRGLAYHFTNNYDAALADYNKVITDAPQFAEAYYYRGHVFYNKKNYDAAINDHSMAIKYDFNAYFARGDNYGAKGLYHKAVTDYKTGLEKGFDPSIFRVDKTNKSDMWFCGAMYMEIAVNRFLGKSDVVAKYENWLKTVSDKNKVTRQEIEAFYRDNVRSLISASVDEEFSKISFMLDTDTDSCNVIMARKGNQYTITCEGYWGMKEKREVREFSGSSLDDLMKKMQTSKSFGEQTHILVSSEWKPTPTYAYLRAQAALIPAVAYTNADIQTIKNELTNFMLTPNGETMLALQRRYRDIALVQGEKGRVASVALDIVVTSLNAGLAERMSAN